jgi:hypothetical protein
MANLRSAAIDPAGRPDPQGPARASSHITGIVACLGRTRKHADYAFPIATTRIAPPGLSNVPTPFQHVEMVIFEDAHANRSVKDCCEYLQ